MYSRIRIKRNPPFLLPAGSISPTPCHFQKGWGPRCNADMAMNFILFHCSMCVCAVLSSVRTSFLWVLSSPFFDLYIKPPVFFFCSFLVPLLSKSHLHEHVFHTPLTPPPCTHCVGQPHYTDTPGRIDPRGHLWGMCTHHAPRSSDQCHQIQCHLVVHAVWRWCLSKLARRHLGTHHLQCRHNHPQRG